MRNVSALALVLTMSALAHAQPSTPTVLSIDAPRLSTRMRRESESCAARHCESVHATAHVVLEVDADGSARISLRGDRRTLRVPASSTAGPPALEHRSSRERAIWSGHARRSEQTLVITLDRIAHAVTSDALAGVLPPPREEPFAGEVRCRIEPVAVFPATPALDERPTSIGLARCRWAEPPPIFAAYGSQVWTLGAGPGVYEITTENRPTRHVVRLPP
jgi:hypothetical protein